MDKKHMLALSQVYHHQTKSFNNYRLEKSMSKHQFLTPSCKSASLYNAGVVDLGYSAERAGQVLLL
jgi:hypothetical protein